MFVGNGYSSDMAIDDIVYDPAGYCGTHTSTTTPPPDISGSTTPAANFLDCNFDDA